MGQLLFAGLAIAGILKLTTSSVEDLGESVDTASSAALKLALVGALVYFGAKRIGVLK
jgi:hypothetical protein